MRLRGGASTAAVVMFAVARCTDQQTKGSAGLEETEGGGAALAAAESLTVKGRAPKSGYSRDRFGTADTDTDTCDTRVISKIRRVIAAFAQLMQGVVSRAY